MVSRACNCASTMVRSTLNLSLKGRDHTAAAGFEAVSAFMVARNAVESFMGRVVAFCSEKSCRPAFAGETAAPLRVRSTEKDSDRTSGLKSEFLFGSAFPNRTVAGYTPGFLKIPFASRAASRGCRPAATSNTSNSARAQTPFAWVPRQSDRCCCAAAFLCSRRVFSTISSISDFSLARFRSASLPVTPNHLIRNNMQDLSTQLRHEFDRRDAWQKAVGGGLRCNEA